MARLRYGLDNLMARSVTPVIGLLGLATALVVFLAGLFLWIGRVRVGGHMTTGVEGFWLSLVRTLDPGTMGADVGWSFRVTSLIVTITGILILSTLIGLLSSGVGRRLEQLRRGRSAVIENGHTLILGWSPKLYVLLTELDAAVEGHAKGCAVILADRDTVEMEDEIEAALPHLRHLRIVTRSGDPTDPHTLRRGAPFTARSITVLGHSEYGDAYTIRCVLALESIGLDRAKPVVIELNTARRAHALDTASDLNVHTIVASEWIASIAARVVLQPSLSRVYEDLLDFSGTEIHRIASRPELVGMSIRDLSRIALGASIIGVESSNGLQLAPDPMTVMSDGDFLVVLAETSITANFNLPPSALWNDPLLRPRDRVRRPASLAIIGWSDLGTRIMDELNRLLPAGSRLEVCVEDEEGAAELASLQSANLQIRYEIADPTDPEEIKHLLDDPALDRAVLLAGRKDVPPLVADARVLLSLLELRHVIPRGRQLRVVAELLNPQSMNLVAGEHSEVFVVGDRLVCLLMAQAIHDERLVEVLRTLIHHEGPELIAIPGTEMMPDGHSTKYGTIGQFLLDGGEYLLGYVRDGYVVFHPAADDLVTSTDELVLLTS